LRRGEGRRTALSSFLPAGFGELLRTLNLVTQSKSIARALSIAAEIERDLISQRTTEALTFKEEQGFKLGRPKGPGKSKLNVFRPEIEGLLANGSTQKCLIALHRIFAQKLGHDDFHRWW
jgi:DNA invertase Pin-like site-specific DNA recombinase